MQIRLMGLSFVAAVSLQAATILNVSFETPSLGLGNFQYDPAGATWTFSGSSGIAANGSAMGYAAAPNGTQAAFLQGGGASFSEMITSVNVGDVVNFWEAQRPGFVANSFNVVYNGNVIGSFTPASTTWTEVSVIRC